MVLSRQPYCVECLRHGITVRATDVDHIVPRRDGGRDVAENLQSLCHSCHSKKTGHEKKRTSFAVSKIPVTIVGGPPGAGKTTYVNQHKLNGDLVLDVDALYVALSGGLDWYDKPDALLPFVLAARDGAIRRLAMDSSVRHAWIITSESDLRKLLTLKQQLGASLHMLEVDRLECMRRISKDERRGPNAYELWYHIVKKWFDRWEKSNRDAEPRP